MKPDLPGIGKRLKQAREMAGLSQAQAARLMSLHRPTITEIENETRKVSAGELKQFARIFKVSVSWLAGEKQTEADTVRMAARKLSSLKERDRDMVLRIIESLRGGATDSSD
jgi:transcriptional regulator with XRE-family HTH domain